MRFINSVAFSIRRTFVLCGAPKMMDVRHSSHMTQFKECLKAANNVVIISGDDISSESGLPVYGSSGLWRKYQASSLATSGAFLTFPSIVWEFYHYRRELAVKAKPNDAHKAIAKFEEKYGSEKSVTVITQSVDGLHTRAGTKNLIELHGNLFKTRCIKCQHIEENTKSPICEALKNRGSPEALEVLSNIPESDLPHCNESGCSGLLRPNIAWFGESLESDVVEKAEEAMSKCDVCMVVGSSLMFPAAMYAPEAMNRGAIVAEFNSDPNRKWNFHYLFQGPISQIVPEALNV
uniref:Deacetylase sirtuin-type domain-containing protein n=2 Tax=Heliothis virescens TaxID=7102 RepID=A0A2A4J8L1_HELVI